MLTGFSGVFDTFQLVRPQQTSWRSS